MSSTAHLWRLKYIGIFPQLQQCASRVRGFHSVSKSSTQWNSHREESIEGRKKTTRNYILNSITTWGVINGNIIVSDGKG